jgi:hypothetical protein
MLFAARPFLAALLFFLSIGSAGAATYYINSRTGDDGRAGTTTDAAWKGLTNLERRDFLPGDSILFADGSSYTGGFVFHSSGTAGKPIVFSHYHIGPDIIHAIPRSKLDSIFIKYGGGPAPSFTNPDWTVLHGNIFQVKGSYIILEGLYFHDNTYPPNSDHINKNVEKMGAVYFALGANHNIIRQCEFFHSPVGIKIKGSYDLVTHNYLHDASDKLAYSWGPLAIMIVKPYNEICYNRIENYGSYGGPYGSDGGVVELDGVDDDFDGRQVNIHHNISINNHGFLELAGRGMDSITVAYNVSDDTNQFIGGGSMRNVFVYNNTVIRTRDPNIDRYIFWTFNLDSTSLVVRNNIFVLPPDIQVYGPLNKTKGHQRSRVGNQPHDHNLYFFAGNSPGDPLGGIVRGEGDRVADPMFVDARNGNFRLLPGSPARAAGAILHYKEDLDGYPIPKNRRPDIGAY